MYGLQLYPLRNENSYSTASQIVNRLRQDSDTLLFYDAADPRYDGGQIPFDAAYRHFDGYLGSLWPAHIAPAGYEPTTDLSVTVVDGEADHLQSDLTTTPSGDFDVRLKCSAANWESAGANYLVSQWTSTGSQRAVTLYRSGASLAMLYSINGSGSEAALAVPSSTSGLTDGETYWLRWVFTSATATLEVFTSVDGVSWTSHGTDTNAAAHTLFDSSSGWEVCGLNGAQNITTDTTVYAVEVIDGSTTIIDLDFTRDAKAGETSSVTDLTGNVWTFNGSLTVTDENGLTPDTKALRLPGTTGNYVSTPDTAALDITGSIDIRVHFTKDDIASGANQAVVSKWLATGNQRSWLVYLTSTGVPGLIWYTDGGSTPAGQVTATAALTTVYADGDPMHLRVTLDTTTGNVNFYTGSSYTDQLGTADQGGAGATSIFSGTAEVSIGGTSTAATSAGLFFAVEVYDGIAGTLVLDVDFDRDAGLYDTSFTGNDGLTYTVNQSAATTNDPLVFGAGANADYSFTGTKYVWSPGTSGNYLSTPDAAALDITGDIDLRIHCALDDWTPASNQGLIRKRGSAPQYAYYLRINATTGYPQLRWSADGTAETTVDADAAVSGVAANGQPIWLRATLDVSTGNVNFYTSTDGSSWTQLGTADRGGGGATSISNSNAELQIMGLDTSEPAVVYAVQVYDGIGGTKVIDLDVNRDTIAADHSTITDAEGNVWTVNRSAAPSFQTTVIDRPLWLFGADTWIDLPSSADWGFADGGEKTIIAAVRANTTIPDYSRLIDSRGTGGGAGIRLGVTTSDNWQASFADDAAVEASGDSNTAHTTPGVTVASGILTATEVSTRCNGTPDSPNSRGAMAAHTGNALRIGAENDSAGDEYTGGLWFAAVFDRALTEKELRALEIIYG